MEHHGKKTFREKFEAVFADKLSGNSRKKTQAQTERAPQAQETHSGKTVSTEQEQKDKVGDEGDLELEVEVD